jgi:HAD superfamily hydrolase (TIGR01549 family)
LGTRVRSLVAAVTFDLWHTLVQLSPAAEDRYLERQEAALTDIVGQAPPSPDCSGRAALEPAVAARLAISSSVERKGQGSPIEDLARKAAESAGRIPQPELWVRAVERLVDEQPFEEVPGARAQLDRLVREGYRTAVVSNLVGESGRSMRRVLERLGMARFIDAWALSEELPWAKPAPEIFWHALEPLGIIPADAVHIGDLGSDVQGARAAGFRGSVQFLGARAYGPRYASLCRTDEPIVPPPDRLLSSWIELPRLLDELFPDGARGRPPRSP